MSTEVPMVGKVGAGYAFFRLGSNVVELEGTEVTVDISSQEFRRQWWKVEFEGCHFVQVGNDLELVQNEPVVEAPVVETKTKGKAKAPVDAPAE